jgi:hypothetical protein
VPQELRRLAIAHLLEGENPARELLPRKGQPFSAARSLVWSMGLAGEES